MGDTSEKVCVGFVGTCEKYYTDETGIPMYRTGNLNGLSLNKDDMKYVTRDFHQQNKKSQLKFGDILIARHGDSGKAVNYESSEEANCLNIVIIRPDFKKCNYRFLTDCINSPRCQKHIKSLSAGSTQAVINTSEIEKLEVLLPGSIDEQEKVAAYFENLDHLITLHQRKPIPHPNHPTAHTKHKGEEKYVRIRVNDRGKINRTANLRRFPVDIPGGFKN